MKIGVSAEIRRGEKCVTPKPEAVWGSPRRLAIPFLFEPVSP